MLKNQMNYTLQTINQTSQYRHLTLHIEYDNETSLILTGEEAFNYFYNKIVMDIYAKERSSRDMTDAFIEENIKWLMSWFVFIMFWRMVFYLLRLLIGASKSKPSRIVVNRYRKN
jgi:hypothetical protein